MFLLCLILCQLVAAEQCASGDDVDLMQMQSTRLRSAGVKAPELSSVDVEFSLVDADGLHIFDSHPSLLQKRGQSHLGDLRSNSLRLTFEAYGHQLDLTFQKVRAPLWRNASLTVDTEDGVHQFHIRDRHIFVHPHAVLTSVGSTVKGVLRHSEVFLDLELQQGSDRLTVRGKDVKAVMEKPLSLPEQWRDCYKNDVETHALGMGVVVGSKLFSSFQNKDEAIDYVVQMFASANLVYRPQLNFVLVARKLHLQESHEKAPSWDQGPSCPMSIAEQLNKFDDWDPPGSDQLSTEGQGLWTLLDDCFVSGTIGLAYVGTLCQMEKNYWDQRPNTAVVWHSYRTWITFAHEVGHNFGGEHSFELGKGTTGGIMDYGDGQLDGKFQFNTQFRKSQMCDTLNLAVRTCKGAIWLFNGQCGNGILTDDEQCECADGSLSCAFCHQCSLESGKSCTPAGYGVHPIGLGVGTSDCCTSNGTFQRSGAVCHVPGVGDGFCTAGLCIPSKCSEYHFVGEYCGLQPQNDCKFMCLDEKGACSNMDGWLVQHQPANYVRDQVPCNWKKAGDGMCIQGSCVPALEGCGNGLVEEGEECECQDGSLSCRYCTNCKLDQGKQCSPDGTDGACCDVDGSFRSGDCQTGSFKGYCMRGLCQDTPCSTYKKSWSGWGDFCGLHEHTTCKFKCEVDGKCDDLRTWNLGGLPLNYLADGTHCDLDGRGGLCKEGICEAIPKKEEAIGTGKSAEDLNLQPPGGKGAIKEDVEANSKLSTCANCVNGVNCNIIRARLKFTKSCKAIERDYGCDCSSCSACSEAKQPKKNYDGCPKTCGGWGWFSKNCDTHIWNSRHQGESRWTCESLQSQWNCNCEGCLLCEHDYDESKLIE